MRSAMESPCASSATDEGRLSAAARRFLSRPIVKVMIIGLAIRVVLMPLLTPGYDMTYWMRIMNMAESGMGLYVVEGYY